MVTYDFHIFFYSILKVLSEAEKYNYVYIPMCVDVYIYVCVYIQYIDR